MSLFKISFKITLQLFFVIIFFSTLEAKNANKFKDSSKISNYFSGILMLNDYQYLNSYKYLKKLKGLEESHLSFSSNFVNSLVNSGKINEAYLYAKKLEKKNLNTFESDLIIGIYYLKTKKIDLAQKYFLTLKNKNFNFVLNNFVSNSIYNWSSFKDIDIKIAEENIDSINPKFENLKDIQKAFLHCFYGSKKTEFYFKKLISNPKVNFSRYNYFYSKYLISVNKNKQAKKVIDEALELYPRNLILNQFKLDFNQEKNKNNFSCKDQSNIIAEIFYITANALSSQSVYQLSNFYLNLAKYLNSDFVSFDHLLAENFYKLNKLNKAKDIYSEMGKRGAAFNWYSAKQNSKILLREDKKKLALKLVSDTYNNISDKNIYQTFDFAEFLKDNDQFKESIKVYSEVIDKISKNHSLYPEATDGRGVAYERIGNWDKAEKDLLSSLEASPDQAYVINYLAYSWIEQGVKIDKSLKMLEKANKLKSNDPYIIDSLGWAFFKLKKYEDAKKYLQRAVQLLPADPTVNDHFGDVLWKSGKKIQARYYWNYVLNLETTKVDLKDNIKIKLISGI